MNEIKFFIPGPLPGMNEMIDQARTHWSESAKSRKMWVRHISNIIGNVPRFEQVYIYYHWLEKDRRRDPDNIVAGMKLINDAMIDAGLISNDGWLQIIGFQHTWSVDKKRPGCYVRVVNVEGGDRI